MLKFPGKICTDVTGAWLFVSDSAHNQILEVDRKTGDLIEQCGGVRDGLCKGGGVRDGLCEGGRVRGGLCEGEE